MSLKSFRSTKVVIADFAGSGDPVFPHGVKSHALLESAVNRQHSGSGSWLKYADPIANAATLAFGICCDHPFHNGNKRTDPELKRFGAQLLPSTRCTRQGPMQ